MGVKKRRVLTITNFTGVSEDIKIVSLHKNNILNDIKRYEIGPSGIVEKHYRYRY